MGNFGGQIRLQMTLTAVMILMAVASVAGFSAIPMPGRKSCKDAFAMLDQDGDGMISKSELRMLMDNGLQSMGEKKPTEEQFNAEFKIIDKDHSDVVDAQEFALALCEGEAFMDLSTQGTGGRAAGWAWGYLIAGVGYVVAGIGYLVTFATG